MTSPESFSNVATLAQNAYTRSPVAGHTILSQYSSPDRTVYQRHADNKVFVSFRGTDVSDFFQKPGEYAWHDKPTSYMKHGAKALWDSRAFRDVSTDAMLAVGVPKSALNRFRNAETVTKKLIDTYGKENVVSVGHSLGGSQALHVSNKYGIEAHAISPHVVYNEVKAFPHAYLYHNLTDPVSFFAPVASAKGNYIGFDLSKKAGVQQHSIDTSQKFPGLAKSVWNLYKSPYEQQKREYQRSKVDLDKWLASRNKARR